MTGRQIAAARALLGMTQPTLAGLSNISVPTLKRMEGSDGAASGLTNNVAAVVAALEAAGVEFIFENDCAFGVKMRNDRTWGYVRDNERIVGRVKDGEFREDKTNKLIAVVKDAKLYDPATGDFIGNLDCVEDGPGRPLPAALKAKLSKT